MESDDFEIGFLCLFCGEEIAEDAGDGCELSVETLIGVAQFTAHLGCLRAASHDPEIFPDLVTPRRLPEGWREPTQEELKAWEELNEVQAEISELDLNPEQARTLAAGIRALAGKYTDS